MTHQEKIERISNELKLKTAEGKPLSLNKGGVSHMVPKPNDPKHKDQKVNLSDLNEILSIDAERKICVAEPGAAFCDVVKATLKHGLVPMLVPELKTITLGGAISGCSVESMSYKFGGFHDSCLEYEVLTASGEVMLCTPEKNAEVFHMMHGSYGTLGIISKITFKLIPAKPFVRMDYTVFKSFAALKAAIMTHSKARDVDFMDAIVHAKDKCVLCVGTFVDTAPYVSDYTFLNIFYKSTLARREDYLTTSDYFFRYDTECHWLSKSLPVPGMETKFMRLLLGKVLLSSTNLLSWAKKLRPILQFDKRPDIVVDVFIPANRLDEFYADYCAQMNYFPLWIVPYRRLQNYPWVNDAYSKDIGDELFFDVAVYGMKNRDTKINYYEVIEDITYKHRGLKTLISHNFYSKDRFWKIYNQENFKRIKKITDPSNRFRDLYEKFHFN